jgi:hypothetical protein
LREPLDLVANPLLLFQRHRNRLDHIPELRAWRLHTGDGHLRITVEQVLDEHHRVVALLERLFVEQRREAWQRQAVVVDCDRDVLLLRGELVGDLLVDLLLERI